MSFLTRALDPNNLRPFFDVASIATDVVRGVREDKEFLGIARRALLPLPTDKEPALDAFPFPPFLRFDAPALRGKKVGVVGSGGSGATAALAGVQRAFEEAGVEPAIIAAASGGALFGGLWAAGLRAEAVAHFWLSLPRKAYFDPDWRALVASTGRALGGWAGLMRGAALEASVRGRLGDKTLGEAKIPFVMPAWNVDLNRVELLGTRQTPNLTFARALRVAISLPIFVEPVALGGHLYADGGIVDIFPVRPAVEAGAEVVVGLNAYLPENFTGEDVTGWRQRPFGLLRASGQVRWSGMVALAREQALLAKDRLILLHPVPYAEVRGSRFYETFVDRSKWPDFMRAGHRVARESLAGEALPQG